LIGQTLDCTFRDCWFTGGMWAAANLPMGSNYSHVFDRCHFVCNQDAALYLNFSIARLRDCEIHAGGRVNLRFRESSVVVDGMFIAGCSSNCQFSVMRFHGGDDGQCFTSIHDVIQDVEGFPTPTRAAIGLDINLQGAVHRFTDIDTGEATGVPVLWLNGLQPGQTAPRNMVLADNFAAWNPSAYSVTVGSGFTGSFVNTGGIGDCVDAVNAAQGASLPNESNRLL
jgi:hypothetical protein